MMADLDAVRTAVIKQSGRFDLVTDAPGGDFSNLVNAGSIGINHYINKAQRMLDRLLPTPQSKAWFDNTPSAGTYSLEMTDVRSILEFWIANATDRKQIGRLPLPDFMDKFDTPTASITNGACPTNWAIAQFNRAPARIGQTLPTYGFEEMITGDATTKQGVIWSPPSDGTYSVLVLGLFYSEALSADTDVSFWTANHEEILIDATRYLLESAHKNREGMADFKATFQEAVADIDKDNVEEEISGVGQLDG